MCKSLLQKYRPKIFKEIFGQDLIINILINILKKKIYYHSYIFSGPSGTGKTTLARIFSKALNCTNLIDGISCDFCHSCNDINNNCSTNIIEVDAASKTKVDETKELLNDIKYLPQFGNYKIYIIDEIHMLSNHSFNALLKILEEPPFHVKFLFITTEKNKIPSTILSRCLHLDLKKINIIDITKYLIYLLNNQNILYNKKDLYNISIYANGNMRNAVNILEKIIVISNNNIILKKNIDNIIGIDINDYLISLINGLIHNDIKKITSCIKIICLNNNYQNILFNLQLIFNNLIKIKIYNNLKYNNYNYHISLILLSKKIELNKIQIYNQILLSTIKNMKYISDLKLEFEIMILKMLTFSQTYNYSHTYKTENNNLELWFNIKKYICLSDDEKNLINNCIFKSWNKNKIILFLNISLKYLYTKEIILKIKKNLSNYLQDNEIEIEIIFIKEELQVNDKIYMKNKNTYIKSMINTLKNKIDKTYIK
ncbi:MAG TPA: DNA polymerase III subunit gamma/tau [Candidatus Azosocius sp. HAIN]